MKTTHAAVTAFVVLAASACASMPIRTDYDEQASFGRLRTYNWAAQKTKTGGDPAFNSPLLDRRIHAVDGVLGRMGYRKVDSNTPDFRVAYEVSTEERLVSPGVGSAYTYPTFYGYPWYGGYRRFLRLSWSLRF